MKQPSKKRLLYVSSNDGTDIRIYKELKVKDIMTSKPFSLTTEASVEEVAQVLSLGNYHAIPILENDKLVGIVSTADIIKFFLNKAS